MKIIKLQSVMNDERVKREVMVSTIEGKVFLYPTDTVYGLGCDASNPDAVRRIRNIKTTGHPFSVIAPSKGWIMKNCVVRNLRCLDMLPGPYTLIFRLKGKPVSELVSKGTLGVRIPRHPFTKIIQDTGLPFVTTSANMSGEVPVWSTQGIPNGIERNVDIAVHDDILNNPPSKVIDLTGRKSKTLRE